MAKEEKTNLYLLAIVGIVAVVGIVVLILFNGGIETDTTNSDTGTGSCTADEFGVTCTDFTGEAILAKMNCEVYGADDEACYEAVVYNNDLSCANLLFSMKTTRKQCSVLDKTSEPPTSILNNINSGESYTYVVAYWADDYVFSGVQRSVGVWEWENH